MKTNLLICAITLLLFSCSDDDNNTIPMQPEIVGNWQLIEIYADPGDGNGTFVTVDSQKTIRFLSDGTVTSNGSLCESSLETDGPMSGTYSLTDSTITSVECIDSTIDTTFELLDSQLIISYPCIEPCKEKYEKIQ